jgi:hypothetical protein
VYSSLRREEVGNNAEPDESNVEAEASEESTENNNGEGEDNNWI